MLLAKFREQLQVLMHEPGLRPFVCHGSPLVCEAFIVGFNPATAMDQPFWTYWSDETGFDKPRFMRDYLQKRGLKEPKGVRARIERIVAELPTGMALETNICSKPTRTAVELHHDDRNTAVFRFLLDTVRPRLVYVHSNDPIGYFEQLTGVRGFDKGVPKAASHGGHTFQLLGTRGPLFRMGFEAATELGRSIHSWLQAAA
jgi:hypothetical protein